MKEFQQVLNPIKQLDGMVDAAGSSSQDDGSDSSSSEDDHSDLESDNEGFVLNEEPEGNCVLLCWLWWEEL